MFARERDGVIGDGEHFVLFTYIFMMGWVCRLEVGTGFRSEERNGLIDVLGDRGACGRLKWVLQEFGRYAYWIRLARERVHWQAFLNTGCMKVGKFQTS